MKVATLLLAAVLPCAALGKSRPRGFSGHVPAMLRGITAPVPSGELALDATNLREGAHVQLYNLDGTLDAAALKAIEGVFRCKRTGDRRPIDPRLLEVLSHVFDRYRQRIQLLSGYRNQENTYSYHYLGSAADIRVPGVSIRALRRFVETLDEGGMGIGLYPKSGFVHVDVRPPPSYRWVDTSTTQDREKRLRPPRVSTPRSKGARFLTRRIADLS
jgi:uncharacterized protein YcbK (DUF882 family)